MKKRSRLQTTGKFIIMVLLLTIAVSLSHGQQRKAYNLSRLGKEKMLVTTRPLKPIADGSKDGVSLDGIAWLKGIEFTNGTIEVDLRGKDLFQRSFVGIAFHGVDTTNYDAVYFRPFNFRSDDSVRRIHAVQYIHPPKLDWFVLSSKT
jgi:hypothetical protein